MDLVKLPGRTVEDDVSRSDAPADTFGDPVPAGLQMHGAGEAPELRPLATTARRPADSSCSLSRSQAGGCLTTQAPDVVAEIPRLDFNTLAAVDLCEPGRDVPA